MDFSTTASALRSLERRTTVPSDLRQIATNLSQPDSPFTSDSALLASTPSAESAVLTLLGSSGWEGLSVGLLLARHMALTPGIRLSDNFVEVVFDAAGKHLEHAEPRVRALVSTLLGAMARREGGGVAVYERFCQRLSDSIQTNFERSIQTIKDQITGGKEVAVDDTSGWKALETSIMALTELVAAVGRPLVTKGYMTDVIIMNACRGAAEHVNRHVREASFRLIAAIIEAAGTLEGSDAPPLADSLVKQFTAAISTGLQDNWSQVRFASSVAVRALLLALPSEAARDKLYPELLPRMCLNRYYMAEGVKIYSQETWGLVMGDKGREVVARHAGAVVKYYIQMTEANNHVVREGACHSIAEMAAKVDAGAVAPYVPQLLSALLACFRDESWPVRDAACVASGRFAAAFPNECRGQLEELLERWFKHLAEPIWSVREDSAGALRQVCEAYGDEVVSKCVDWVKNALPKAWEQPAQTREQHKALHNDVNHHTDKQRYSCGSLAPKLKRGGCADCELTRPSDPWEIADGGIYMVKELCAVAPAQAVQLLPKLADMADLTHFPQADNLRETLWKQLPSMANSLGKKTFKQHLEPFVNPLFATLTRPGTHQLALHAAGSCVRFIEEFIGPSIFRGRLSPDQLAVLESSPFTQGGGMGYGLGGCPSPMGVGMGGLPIPGGARGGFMDTRMPPAVGGAK